MTMETETPLWELRPTALECAHYDRLLRLAQNKAAQRDAETQERVRKLFGECLLTLCKLGVREAQARSLIGKWRKALGNDHHLAQLIQAADRNNVPDPVSYITAAIRKLTHKTNAVEAISQGKWTLLGWEEPRITSRGIQWKGDQRGQVWRDPFGKLTILPADAGTDIPDHEVEPGIDLSAA